MKHLLLIYNPRSSRFKDVDREVLEKARHLKGWMIGKFEVSNTDVDDNAARLAKILKDHDLVIAAGGDATATIAANAVIQSPHENIRLGVLGYGNFNDVARSLGKPTFDEIIAARTTQKIYPLECRIDGQHYRYGLCYFTIGMFAEACAIFDDPKVRHKLRSKRKKSVFFSILALAKWWFQHRKTRFLPSFTLNEAPRPNQSDYVAINAPSMAKLLRGRPFFRNPKTFRSTTGHLTTLPGLTKIILPSIFHQIPGKTTTTDALILKKPAKIMIQAEGEYKKLQIQSKIEIQKSPKPLNVIIKERRK